MGVFTYETETTSAIPPAKLFKAFVLDADNLIPKVAPHAIKSAEIIEGNGGPGTIKKITFGEGNSFLFSSPTHHLYSNLKVLILFFRRRKKMPLLSSHS